MDSDIEIPIWFNGKIKWISNLTRRSTCEDVIKAILSSDGKGFSTNEILYESWRGVERPLKNRCRLLKLWKSWSGEASNVTLTLRNDQSSIDDRTCLLIEQEKKLKKLKKKFEKQNFLFEKYSNENQFIHDEYQQTIQCYLHLYRSILQLEKQIRSEEKSISTLIEQIQEENQRNSHSENLFEILSDVHQTLIISRKLTEQSEQLDEQIQQINDDIDRKQSLLDELELDDALEQNIDLDSLDDENENEEEISHRNSMKNTEHRSEWEYHSPSLPPKIKTSERSLPLLFLSAPMDHFSSFTSNRNC